MSPEVISPGQAPQDDGPVSQEEIQKLLHAKTNEPVEQSDAPAPGYQQNFTDPPRKSKKKWLAAGGIAVIIALLAAAYVFAFYLPNTPGQVFNDSLSNTGKAVDMLINYSRTQQNADYKSAAFDGQFNLKSPDLSYDLNLSGTADKSGNANVTAKADIAGEKAVINLRSIKITSSDSPDLYVQVSGDNIKSLLQTDGMSPLSKYVGQWISIDHTLLDSYKRSLQSDLDSVSGTGLAHAGKTPTRAQIQDAVDKVQGVNKQYLFSSDPDKTVLTNEKYLGKETKNGVTLYHYQVDYNKAHLEAYVNAVGTALDSSQLNEWSKQVNHGKNISESMNFADLKKSVANAKTGYTFDLWADKHLKIISKLSFKNLNDMADIFTVSQGYTGGSKFPLNFSWSGSAGAGNSISGSLGLTVDTSTNKFSLTIASTAKDSAGGVSTANGSFNLTPGKNPVTVTAPANATPVLTVLNSLGLGGLLNLNSTTRPPQQPATLNNNGCTLNLAVACAN